MADMHDRAAFWPEPAAFAQDIPGLAVHDLPELPQAYVSGDLAAFTAAHDLPAAVGLLGQAQGARYTVRLARHRLLAVGLEPDASWNPGGWGVTPIGAGLAVVAITGPRWRELVARATPIDPDTASASAAFLLGDGLPAILTRHDAPENLRLHIPRALLPALHHWLDDRLHAMAG